MRSVNAATLALIKESESLHDGDLTVIGLQPKLCPADIWTIGWGHALRGANGKFLRGEAGRKEAYQRYHTISLEEAEDLLQKDLWVAGAQVERLVKVPLSDGEYGALVSFTMNLGEGNLAASTLLKKLNAGDRAGASGEFKRWNKSGGKVLAGLVKRRAAERVLFLS